MLSRGWQSRAWRSTTWTVLALTVLGPVAGCAVTDPANRAGPASAGAATADESSGRSIGEGTSPSPSPSPPPSLDQRSGEPAQLVDAGPRRGNRIALTFHLGAVVDPAPAMMAWLRDNEVAATIFVSGAAVERNDSDAGREVMQIIDARGDLFELGSHGYATEDFTMLTPEQVIEELRRTEAALTSRAGQDPRPLFAPPAGAWSTTVLAAAGRAGYDWAVLWDVDPVDWKPMAQGGPSSAEIVDRVLGTAQPGSIVLLQLGGPETLGALPDLVAALRQRFRLVRVSELLGLGPVD